MGAGLISGAEVNTFFVKFGWAGVIGIIFASIMFGVCIFIISKRYVTQENCNQKIETKTNLKQINLLPACQALISAAMFAGLTSIVKNLTNANELLIQFILLVVLFVAIVAGINFANVMNVLVSIFLIILLPLVVKNVVCNNEIIIPNISKNRVFQSVFYAGLYVCLNIVGCMPIIKNVAQKNSKNIKQISVVFSLFILMVLGVFYAVLFIVTSNAEMPMLSLIKSGLLKAVYIILLVLAICSSLLSGCCGAKDLFKKINNKYAQSFCTCAIVCAVSNMGFGVIVEYIYPIIGIALIVQLLVNIMLKRHQKLQKYTIKTQK